MAKKLIYVTPTKDIDIFSIRENLPSGAEVLSVEEVVEALSTLKEKDRSMYVRSMAETLLLISDDSLEEVSLGASEALVYDVKKDAVRVAVSTETRIGAFYKIDVPEMPTCCATPIAKDGAVGMSLTIVGANKQEVGIVATCNVCAKKYGVELTITKVIEVGEDDADTN